MPAFSGLFAPYWRSDARGLCKIELNQCQKHKSVLFFSVSIMIRYSALITGMSQYTTRAHIVRAALEGISYQTREVIWNKFIILTRFQKNARIILL